MEFIKNLSLTGSQNLPIALDLVFEKTLHPLPVVIYAHGFNGFKDWGNFDLVASKFAAKGFALVKFNFSHNGTTPEQPEVFGNLEAFANNNYSRQLEDLRMVINWICDPANAYAAVFDTSDICLIGHSMGGGISILQASEDSRIKKLITWAAISECKTPWSSWTPEKIEEWKHTGVQHYTNSRTGQEMPMYYQLYEDYLHNRDRLDIKQAIKKLTIPVLICHGSLDSSVSVEKAYELKEWQPAAKLFILDTDHVFGRRHPWQESGLPPAMEAVTAASIEFLRL